MERGLSLPGIEKTVEGASLYLMGAGLFHRQGKYTEEERWASRSARLAQNSPVMTPEVLAQMLSCSPIWPSRQGNPQRALELGQASLEFFRNSRLRGEMDARKNLLLIHLGLSQWQRLCARRARTWLTSASATTKVRQSRANLGKSTVTWRSTRSARSLPLGTELNRCLGVCYGEAIREKQLARHCAARG